MSRSIKNLVRRPPRRGLLARVKRFFQKPSSDPGFDQNAPVQPLRAQPSKIQFIEEYYYKLDVKRQSVYEPKPTNTLGEIRVDFPFEKMDQRALADAERSTRREVGDISARYGWLALNNVTKSNIVSQLSSVRAWNEHNYHAFPLISPLLDKDMERLEERLEGGWHERDIYNYTPSPLDPFPVRFDLSLIRDSMIPLDPLNAQADGNYRLGAANSSSGREFALMVRMALIFRRPAGLTDADFNIRVDRFSINWPVPVVASQFTLRTEPGRLFVDSRFNQVVMDHIPIPVFASRKKDFVEAQIAFPITVRQPTHLQGKDLLKGRLKILIEGAALSGVRAQYFDATGYPLSTDYDGKPLVEYRTELFTDFTYSLSEALQEAPILMERHYTWAVRDSSPKAFQEVQKSMEGQGFAVNKLLDDLAEQDEEAEKTQHWWAERQIAGQPLYLDVRMEKTIEVDDPRRLKLPEYMGYRPQTRGFFDLTIRAYYRGRWGEARRQLDRLEERLRRHLHLRRQGE